MVRQKLSASARKTLDAFEQEYGAARGEEMFYGHINKQRRHNPGSKFLKSMGKGTDEGAASGGQGRTHAKALPFRAEDASEAMHKGHRRRKPRGNS